MPIARAEVVLKQSLKTAEYFSSNITYVQDFGNKLSSGMDVVDKAIATIPFRRKLARFYVAIKKTQQALDQYSKIQHSQHNYFNTPNTQEGETLLEVAKYLHSIGSIKKSREVFIQACLFFNAGHGLPFRLLDFSKNLFGENEMCFCGSNKRYSECHHILSSIKSFAADKEIPLKITGLPLGSRVSLFLLKTHKNHPLVYAEEYFQGYELSYTEKPMNIFDYKIITNKEIPMMIQILHHESLPVQIECVLREKGLSINLTKGT